MLPKPSSWSQISVYRAQIGSNQSILFWGLTYSGLKGCHRATCCYMPCWKHLLWFRPILNCKYIFSSNDTNFQPNMWFQRRDRTCMTSKYVHTVNPAPCLTGTSVIWIHQVAVTTKLLLCSWQSWPRKALQMCIYALKWPEEEGAE
jgi:hypothetical protein